MWLVSLLLPGSLRVGGWKPAIVISDCLNEWMNEWRCAVQWPANNLQQSAQIPPIEVHSSAGVVVTLWHRMYIKIGVLGHSCSSQSRPSSSCNNSSMSLTFPVPHHCFSSQVKHAYNCTRGILHPNELLNSECSNCRRKNRVETKWVNSRSAILILTEIDAGVQELH